MNSVFLKCVLLSLGPSLCAFHSFSWEILPLSHSSPSLPLDLSIVIFLHNKPPVTLLFLSSSPDPLRTGLLPGSPIYSHPNTFCKGLPCSSNGKESACNAGDTGSIPESGRFPLEEGMAIHSSMLAWRILWTENPGGLHPTGLQSQTRLSIMCQACIIFWFSYLPSSQHLLRAVTVFANPSIL